MKNVRITLWSLVAIAIIAVGGLWVSQRDHLPIAAVRLADAETVIADFELTDHNGMMQTDEDFRGRWMLVFFGFANCPDVCPMGLSTIGQVMDDLADDGTIVQPLFITVDPERDTPSVLAEYVPQFGPSILGLSGPPEQTMSTAKAFKVYYQRNEDEYAPDGYTIGHTSSFLLFNPQGEFVRIYEYNADPSQIVSDLKQRIEG